MLLYSSGFGGKAYRLPPLKKISHQEKNSKSDSGESCIYNPGKSRAYLVSRGVRALASRRKTMNPDDTRRQLGHDAHDDAQIFFPDASDLYIFSNL